MRDFRQDLTGKTDSSGNATLTVHVPQTGEWHNVKIGVSTGGPAEWAVLLSGTPVTFGRGRRVTLGPELVRDGETITVNVTGGPASSNISGSVTGVSGAPEEVMSTFAPQPNTIALDTSATSQLLGTVTAPNNSQAAVSFTLPPGTQAVGFIPDLSGINLPVEVKITGDQTNNTYLDITSGSFVIGAVHVWAEMINANMDTSVTFTVTAPVGGPAKIKTLAWLNPAVVLVRAPPGEALSVDDSGSNPALWQVPTQLLNVERSTAGVTAMLAGVANTTIRMFGWELAIDGQASGTTIAFLEDSTGGVGHRVGSVSLTGAGAAQVTGSLAGGPLPGGAGSGLNFNVAAIATGPTIRAFAGVSQG